MGKKLNLKCYFKPMGICAILVISPPPPPPGPRIFFQIRTLFELYGFLIFKRKHQVAT